MKKALFIMISLQLLINSMLGYAHMAVDTHDEHESAHVHAGGHLPTDIQLVDEANDHETETHAHMCFVLLNNPEAILYSSVSTKPLSLDSVFYTLLLAPPVPPPTV